MAAAVVVVAVAYSPILHVLVASAVQKSRVRVVVLVPTVAAAFVVVVAAAFVVVVVVVVVVVFIVFIVVIVGGDGGAWRHDTIQNANHAQVSQ